MLNTNLNHYLFRPIPLFVNGYIRPSHFFSPNQQIYITISTNTSVCPSDVRPASGGVRHKIFFSLKSPWDHSLTPGLIPYPNPPDPRGWPLIPTPRPPGHAAPPEELAKARRAFSSILIKVNLNNYFDHHVCTSMCSCVRSCVRPSQKFFFA